MENLDRDMFEDSSFGINGQSKELLKTIVFWSKFISIVGLIAICGMSIIFLLMLIENELTLGDAITSWVVFSFGIIPLIYLFIFARKTEQSLRESDTIILQKAIQNLKSYFKSIGISMILIFVCLVIFLIFIGIFSSDPDYMMIMYF